MFNTALLRLMAQLIKPRSVPSAKSMTAETPNVLKNKEAGHLLQKRPFLSVAGTCHSLDGSKVRDAAIQHIKMLP